MLNFAHQRNHQKEFRKGMIMKVAIIGSRKYENRRRIQEFIT